MTLTYKLLGIPKTLEEVADFFQQTDTRFAEILIYEEQKHNKKRYCVYLELDTFFRQPFIIDRRTCDLRNNLQDDLCEDTRQCRIDVERKAEEARDYLVKKGIEVNIHKYRTVQTIK